MAEKNATGYDCSVDSGIVNGPRSKSHNTSTVLVEQREEDPAPTDLPGSGHEMIGPSIVVYSQPPHIEPKSIEARAQSDDENNVVPILETQGPPSPPESKVGVASFSIGPSDEESLAKRKPSRSRMHPQVDNEQQLVLRDTQAELKETKDQLKEKKEQLAKAEAKTIEVEKKLSKMTKKKEEVEKELEKVQEDRAKDLEKYRLEVDKYKKKLAEVEKKNEEQRIHYEREIKKLTKEMQEKEKDYNKSVLKLTNQNCDLQVKVANMQTEEQSLKRVIAELQRDLERQEKKCLAEKFEEFRSNSEIALAEKDSRIQTLERMLSEASVTSNSSGDN